MSTAGTRLPHENWYSTPNGDSQPRPGRVISFSLFLTLSLSFYLYLGDKPSSFFNPRSSVRTGGCRATHGLRFAWIYTSLYLVFATSGCVSIERLWFRGERVAGERRSYPRRTLDLEFFFLPSLSFLFFFCLRIYLFSPPRDHFASCLTRALSNSLLSLAKNRISYFVSATRINCAKNLAWLIVDRPFLSEKARVHIHVCTSRRISFYRVSSLVYAYVYMYIYVCIHNALVVYTNTCVDIPSTRKMKERAGGEAG